MNTAMTHAQEERFSLSFVSRGSFLFNDSRGEF